MKLKDIIYELEKYVPLSLQEDWDNSGYQLKLHNDDFDIRRILVTLEITSDVIKEAKIKDVDLIITHHPLLFNSIKQLNIDELSGRFVKELTNLNISVYSSHTPFDICDGGNNTFFGRVLGIDKVYKMDNDPINLARYGILRNYVSIDQVIDVISSKFNIDKEYIRYAGPANISVQKLGWVTGAGSDYIQIAKQNDCDLFITGDVSYHKAREAREINMPTLDIGHYGSEKIFEMNMGYLLRLICRNESEVLISNLDTNPFTMVR